GDDYQSATSNALLKVLKLKGRVLIGDKALVEVLRRKKEKECFIDMAEYWTNREHLPFVFGRLCIRGHYNFFIKIIQSFPKRSIKIPYFLLIKYSQKTGVNKKDILEYLKLISYKIDKKANYGMERFYRKLRILGIKPPKRF
ncbi:MAG: menaquinone biosynthesis protein, partial [Helicobacter sp.]|nr:menaquinone biosynthesis protein [Helicobacter sp.]